MTILTNATHLSLTSVLPAAENITPFLALKVVDGKVAIAGEGDIPLGISIGEFAPDEDATFQILALGYWCVSETVKAGDLLTCGENGTAKIAQDGDFIFAQALQDAAINEAAQILIVRAGVASGSVSDNGQAPDDDI